MLEESLRRGYGGGQIRELEAHLEEREEQAYIRCRLFLQVRPFLPSVLVENCTHLCADVLVAEMTVIVELVVRRRAWSPQGMSFSSHLVIFADVCFGHSNLKTLVRKAGVESPTQLLKDPQATVTFFSSSLLYPSIVLTGMHSFSTARGPFQTSPCCT